MLGNVNAFTTGFLSHVKGIRFGFRHPSFLALSLFPFLITLILYGVGFYLFILHVDDLVRGLWSVNPDKSSQYVHWLYLMYFYVLQAILYAVVLVVMFYVFIVVANVVGSPFYDHISARYQGTFHAGSAGEAQAPGILKTLLEESKKAVFMLLTPLVFLLVPVAGGVLAFLLAAVFIAWDYIDFSLSKDRPLLRDRLSVLWQRKFHFLGFGLPLVVPFVNLLLIPFAILGATRLYYDELRQLRDPKGRPLRMPVHD